MVGSSESTTICSWIPCKISAASQSSRHLVFTEISANTEMNSFRKKKRGQQL